MADRISAFEGDDQSAPIVGTRYQVNAVLADRINRMIAEAPEDIRPQLQHAITSGYRNYATQTALYLHHLAGGGLAAPPGHSWHERLHGMAADWNDASPAAYAYLRGHAYQYGLGFPLGSKDPLHMQPVETYAGGVNQFASKDTGHTVHAAPPPSAFDEEPVDKSPPLPVTPINPVHVSAPGATPGSAPAVPNTIITKPAEVQLPAPYRPVPLHMSAEHVSSLGGDLRQAIGRILRTK